jgi:peptidoglycan hydrolase CwlO-like protein
MTKEELEAELKNLENQIRQLENQANMINGAIAFCKHLLTKMEKENAPEAQQE